MNEPSVHHQALPEGTRLQEFELRGFLGAGGFGIAYLGWNTELQIPVAIKEYLPSDCAVRERSLSVVAKSRDDAAVYEWGLESFLEEARMLARFKHPNIVQIYRFFRAHGTGYIVMEYVEGQTLSERLKEHGVISEEQLRQILLPLLEGLEEVHRSGLTHRDIKPGNIIMRASDDSPVLLDFGAARQTVMARSRSMTAVLTPRYAPIEQYSETGRQGPWTDVYALGALCCRAMTGKAPEESSDRIQKDTLEPLEESCRGQGSPEFLRALDWALRVRLEDRPQSLSQWRAALDGVREPGQRQEPREAKPVPSPAVEPKRRWVGKLAAGLLSALIVAGGGYFGWHEWEAQKMGEEQRLVLEEQRKAAEEKRRLTELEAQGKAAEEKRRLAELEAQDKDALEVQVKQLLAGALADLSARRLTRPAGNNAWEKYQAVLSLSPGNAQAAAGMERVLEEYMKLFGEALSQGDFERAGGYLTQIGTLQPDSRLLEEGERRLAEAKARVEAELEKQRKAEAAEEEEQLALAGEMAAIPGGSFRMGDLSGDGDEEEVPVHIVRIAPFEMGKYEVTFSQWDACVADGGCPRASDEGWGRGNRPVMEISWNDVQGFIAWLNTRTGGDYRLPTESEWEYAARAGSESKYSWGNRIGSNRANCDEEYCGDRWENTAPVGSFASNAWGLHDMHGNVWEWVEDCRNDSYVGAPGDGSAWRSGDCNQRVIRGGSWYDSARDLRSAFRNRDTRSYRNWFTRSLRSYSLGFRLARDK